MLSSRKSNPKWLDRLRSSKGFSSSSDSDLNHFLANLTYPQPQLNSNPSPSPAPVTYIDNYLATQNQPTSLSSKPTDPQLQFNSDQYPAPLPDTVPDNDRFLDTQNQPTSFTSKQTDPQPQLNSDPSPAPSMLGDVLAELFAFCPENSIFPSKKAPRKTPNPRSCKVNSFKNGGLNVRVSQRSDNCSRAGKGELVVPKKRIAVEEEEKMDRSLSGFSRTEVAVIDTSYKGWKFEKVLFRKKSVWKVFDRKSRALSCEDDSKKKVKINMKKRKSSIVEEEEVGVCKKKKKIYLGQCSLSRG